MPNSTVTRAKFSERQQGRAIAVDVLALSPRARRDTVNITLPATTINSTTKSISFPLGQETRVIGGYVAFRTAPVVAGGTCTVTVKYIASDGATVTNIVTAQTILGLTADIPVALTLASADTVKFLVGGSFVADITTSNNAVGTAQVGGTVTLLVEPSEQTVITDTDLGVTA